MTAAQYAFAALGAVMGGFDGFLYALVVFVVVDYATGLMAAVVEKQLSSEVGFKGIFKKVVIFFYLSNEDISILENAARIDLPIPEKAESCVGAVTGGKRGIMELSF